MSEVVVYVVSHLRWIYQYSELTRFFFVVRTLGESALLDEVEVSGTFTFIGIGISFGLMADKDRG